jgi:hypothetical protein
MTAPDDDLRTDNQQRIEALLNQVHDRSTLEDAAGCGSPEDQHFRSGDDAYLDDDALGAEEDAGFHTGLG